MCSKDVLNRQQQRNDGSDEKAVADVDDEVEDGSRGEDRTSSGRGRPQQHNGHRATA
jgi:hypothetical protein